MIRSRVVLTASTMSTEDQHPDLTNALKELNSHVRNSSTKSNVWKAEGGKPEYSLEDPLQDRNLTLVHHIQTNVLKLWLIRSGSEATAHHGSSTNGSHHQV
jgi:hypothetical protein